MDKSVIESGEVVRTKFDSLVDSFTNWVKKLS